MRSSLDGTPEPRDRDDGRIDKDSAKQHRNLCIIFEALHVLGGSLVHNAHGPSR